MAVANLIEQAVALHKEGRHTEAVLAYQTLLRSRPQDATLHSMLAVALAQMGKYGEAVPAFATACRLEPHKIEHRLNLATALTESRQLTAAADVWNDIGITYTNQLDYDKALQVFDRALSLAPGHAGIRNNRASVLCSLGRAEEVIDDLRKLAVANRAQVNNLNQLGHDLLRGGQIGEAIVMLQTVLALDPDHAQGKANLATAQKLLQTKADTAAASNGTGPTIDPMHAAILTTLGDALKATGQLAEALSCFRRAMVLRPDDATVHWNISLALLANGDFKEGFEEFEWRIRRNGHHEPARSFKTDTWRGEKPEQLNGHLLVTSEQGFGDVIQFARYLPLLVTKGYRVIFEVQRPLFTLFWSSFAKEGITVIARMDSPQVIDTERPIAAHTYVMSLAHHFGTSAKTIPNDIPYLHAEPERAARWKKRLAALKPAKPRVGLVWAGRPEYAKDRQRSLSLGKLEPVWSMPDICFVSLQKGVAAKELENISSIAPLGGDLDDFAETAALIENLDLVITVDTAVAHLAGALGKPCWVMLPADADWRWMRDRSHSPWYPTLRLFRQKQSGNWDEVASAIAKDLAKWVKGSDKLKAKKPVVKKKPKR